MLLNCGYGEDSESPLDCKEIQLVNPKGNQSWIFIGRTDNAAEAPILWPPDAKSQLIWKDPNAEQDWRQEEKVIRGWDGWMALLIQRTWVWEYSRKWWKTGKPDVLLSMGSQKSDTAEWTTIHGLLVSVFWVFVFFF